MISAMVSKSDGPDPRLPPFDAYPDTVAAILRRRFGGNVVPASGVSPVVLLDGREFDPAAAAEAPACRHPVVASADGGHAA
jgi:hypothetical protein